MLSLSKALCVFPVHFTLQIINLAWWGSLIIAFGFVKLIPVTWLRQFINPMIANFEIAFGVCSITLVKFFNRIDIDYRIQGELSKQQWYLLMVNHRSYLDVILVMNFAYERIPAPKFFLKQELIWLPFVGLGAWALDMPFMRRYSKVQVSKNPALAGRDITTTKKHCAKYKHAPTSVVNFVEGTRFTPAKHTSSQSPYRYLLRPKAAGLAFAIATLGARFQTIIDISIVYPSNQQHPMLDMLCGRMKHIIIDVAQHQIAPDLIGNYHDDSNYKTHFQAWLNQRWQDKDQRLADFLEE
jgi:1-acyl-sn-glycerol-3-phosphate acyltransferase